MSPEDEQRLTKHLAEIFGMSEQDVRDARPFDLDKESRDRFVQRIIEMKRAIALQMARDQDEYLIRVIRGHQVEDRDE